MRRFGNPRPNTASERGVNTLHRVKDLYLKAKAGIWASLSFLALTVLNLDLAVLKCKCTGVAVSRRGGLGRPQPLLCVPGFSLPPSLPFSLLCPSLSLSVSLSLFLSLSLHLSLSLSHGAAVTSRSCCRANMAHIRQSRPDSGLGFRVQFIETFWFVSSSLGSGCVNPAGGRNREGKRATINHKP